MIKVITESCDLDDQQSRNNFETQVNDLLQQGYVIQGEPHVQTYQTSVSSTGGEKTRICLAVILNKL